MAPQGFALAAVVLMVGFIMPANSCDMKEYFYNQTIDHFNFHALTPSKYAQRIYVCTDYMPTTYGRGNGGAQPTPILFYTGNEADIWTFINNTGAMYELGKKLQALVVFAEHRYYGTSLPFGTQSFDKDKVGYLSVEQAMADFAENIVWVRQQWNLPDSAVIAVGGSYGANLAMWMRLKFPQAVAGALAASATPLKHLLRESDCFYRIVTEVYANVSSSCPDLLRRGFKWLMSESNTQSGRDKIQQVLGVCEPLTTPQAAQATYGWLVNGLETMVQYGYPYPANFDAPLPGYPFSVACKAMAASGTPQGALRAAANVYYNYTGEAGSCYNWGVVLRGAQRSNTAWPFLRYAAMHDVRSLMQKLGDSAGTAWSYQTCTEVFQPMPTNGVTDMFLPSTPNDTAIFEACEQQWGVTPRPNWEEMYFGGSHISAGSNIFLSNGQLDPWRSAGIQQPVDSPTIQVALVIKGAHHLDIRGPNPLDPPSVVVVRAAELKAIQQWIAEWSSSRK